MKEQIQEILSFHLNAKDEVWSILNELNSINDTKMTLEDKEALKTSKIELQKELEISSIIVSDLKTLYLKNGLL